MSQQATDMPLATQVVTQDVANRQDSVESPILPLTGSTNVPRRVYLCRHAEVCNCTIQTFSRELSESNKSSLTQATSKVYNRLTKKDDIFNDIHDPGLTLNGEMQSRETAKVLQTGLAKHNVNITHLLVSPMSRTLETAAIVFKTAI
ncbi:hypothetical protein ONS95_005886 [Cadophora gregata]|uniref:uncharacterized protein n=1 Tax=Cadophora gregata TaxID=51156 RepID=UPI0026DB3228|nr:uncharacterized protein ONS95_005886 [Cadophora gregata]KAK0102264.1 hypothetical protein ONS95_005886 [Cadophora gregata]